MKAFLLIILAVAVSISTALAKHGGHGGQTVDTADSMANTANILARYRCEADASSAAANRENTATGTLCDLVRGNRMTPDKIRK